MIDLIKRLEEAEEGSRELDRDISKLIDKAEWAKCANWASMPCGASPDVIDRDALRWLPDYTTSLDAALALAERVGLSVSQILNEALEGPSGEGIWATGWNRNKPHAPQIAKFVCIAILKATDTGWE